MKCYECGGEYKKQKEVQYRIDDDFVGTFYVTDVEFMKCNGCGDVLLSPESMLKIEEKEAEVLDKLLQTMPINAFLSSTETTIILNISRQTLHKHRRISRGFIFQTTFGGNRVYLKKSVERFLEKGDGRFKLSREINPKPIQKPAVLLTTKSQSLHKKFKEILTIYAYPQKSESFFGKMDSDKTRFTPQGFHKAIFATNKNTASSNYIQESVQSYN